MEALENTDSSMLGDVVWYLTTKIHSQSVSTGIETFGIPWYWPETCFSKSGSYQGPS